MKETDVEFLQRMAELGRLLMTTGDFKRLLSLAEAGRQQWVPVSERLPESGQDCLIWREGFGACVARFWNIYGPEWAHDFLQPELHPVTDWRLLAPPSAPVLPEPWGPANRKGEYQVIDTVLQKPFKHPQCPRCRSLPPLRMLQQVPLIWICDCCTQAFNGELKLWSIADAVLPEGQPQCNCDGDDCKICYPSNHKEYREEVERRSKVSDTSGEPQKGTE